MKVALVHDYLIDYGGAEAVLAALREVYPKAPIYTLVVNQNGMGKFWDKFSDAQIITSWFNYLPFASKLISPLRFLIPLMWGFDFGKFDIVITSASWAVTKGMNKGGKAIEICYLHTPPRYLYGYDTARVWRGKWFSGLIDAYSLLVNHFMRIYDFNQAQKVDYFIANSLNTGKRIEKFYKRKDYKVIYPPVDIREIISYKVHHGDTEPYFLTGGRMVASKNFDLIIRSCQKAGVNLKVYGTGIEEENLKKIGGNNTEFLGQATKEELISLYKNAKGFIVAQKDEDFGITPVEAMAAGTPVIAYKGGGYTETLLDGKTGIFFDELSVESLEGAIKKFEKMKFGKEDCISQAKKFSKERFKKEIGDFVSKKILRSLT